jgi:hypothetical protein
LKEEKTLNSLVKDFFNIGGLIMSQKTTEELLNWATEIAVTAKRDTIASGQINSILSFAQEYRNDINTVMLYIMYQAQRLRFTNTAKILVNKISELKNSPDDVIRLLGYVKWIYEIIERIKVDYSTKKFEDLVKTFITQARS